MPSRRLSSRTTWRETSGSRPSVIRCQLRPKFSVLNRYGLSSSRRCASTTTQAVPASQREASMQLTVAHSGKPFGVISVQLTPPSRLRWTRPSSVPAQIRPCSSGDSATAKMVP